MKARHLFTCLLTLALLAALVPAARADVVWEPDNSFYARHADECSYVGRVYRANGAEGFVTAWNAPNGSGVEAQFENGQTLRVYWRWNDWGCITQWVDGKDISGWINMDDLSLTYDYIAFTSEYADRITPYNGEFADYDGDDAAINFYEYPGAPSCKESRSTDEWYGSLADLTGAANDGYSYIQSVFVDENGLTWGYVAYMYGHVNAWFCLDDPDGECFPVRQVEEDPLIPARTPVMPAKGAASLALPWVLVAAVVAATAVGLVCLRRKKAG